MVMPPSTYNSRYNCANQIKGGIFFLVKMTTKDDPTISCMDLMKESSVLADQRGKVNNLPRLIEF